jgi:Peptidase inhibitor family I36
VDSHFAIRSFQAIVDLGAVIPAAPNRRGKERTMSNTIGRVVTVVAAAGAALATGTGIAAAAAAPAGCERGEFCVWPDEDYGGAPVRVALANANPGECVPLAEGADGRSFVNRTKRPVTVYQGRDCSTEGEFATYPGGGTFVPEAPYVVRAVQIWER